MYKKTVYEPKIIPNDEIIGLSKKTMEDLEFLPDSLIIGDNEGGQVIVYTTGPEGFGVYLTGYGVLDKNESTFIALSLEDFLTKNVGIERLAE